MTARGLSLGLTAALGLGGWLLLAQSRPEPVATPASRVVWKKGSSVKFEKPSDEELKKKLSKLQYEVTQHEATEPPFSNLFNDNHEEGLYVDVVSGEPLFSSKDKYESGSGWPSFTRPVSDDYVVTRTDFKLLAPRSEVRSKLADSHLGHVFPDGPGPAGLRYCMNSAAMRFVPVAQLEAEGYGEYLKLFGKALAKPTPEASRK